MVHGQSGPCFHLLTATSSCILDPADEKSLAPEKFSGKTALKKQWLQGESEESRVVGWRDTQSHNFVFLA